MLEEVRSLRQETVERLTHRIAIIHTEHSKYNPVRPADIALKLEKTVAESMVFELPESGDPVIINLRKIISDTEAHIDRIDRFKLEKGYSLPG